MHDYTDCRQLKLEFLEVQQPSGKCVTHVTSFNTIGDKDKPIDF